MREVYTCYFCISWHSFWRPLFTMIIAVQEDSIHLFVGCRVDAAFVVVKEETQREA